MGRSRIMVDMKPA